MIRALIISLLLLSTSLAIADSRNAKRFGPYELHYIVLPTTFLSPEVADAYDITRGTLRALVNLSLREHLNDGSTIERKMTLTGTNTDLLAKQQTLDFRLVEETGAIYYLAEFRFINEEWRHFKVTFSPENSTEQYELTFKQQLFKE